MGKKKLLIKKILPVRKKRGETQVLTEFDKKLKKALGYHPPERRRVK